MNISANRIGFRTHFISALKLATILCSLSYAHAQETILRQVADTKTDTHVEITALFSKPSYGGFHPVRVFISNNQKKPHDIELNFSSYTDYRGKISTNSDFSFRVEPGKSVTHDILVPLTPQNETNTYGQFGVKLTGSMGKSDFNDNVGFNINQPIVLLSDTLHAPNASALDAENASRSTGYGAMSGFSSRFTPSQLPDDWRAYSGYDAMLLTENDWMAIPPGPRNAILAWLRLGGKLIIYSENTQNPTALGLPSDSSFGEYKIQKIFGTKLEAKPTVDLVYSTVNKSRIHSVIGDYASTWQLQNELGKKEFSSFIFIIILITFGIVVGPINLFVFAKSGRRHRLFITTPIISLVTSLLLIVLIIFQDGFGGAGNRLVLMEVRPDENQNAAFIHQEQFSRTGVMTSPSFTINESALLVPLPIQSNRWSRFTNDQNTSGNYDLQTAGEKLFATGSWFQSRSEQGQIITAVVPTRGRIELTKEKDQLVSNFEFPIETLIYRDEDKFYRADKITKGKAMSLIPIDASAVQLLLKDLNKKFANRNQSFFKKIQNRNGHYIAITSDAPAVETHPSIDWKTTTIITGPIVR